MGQPVEARKNVASGSNDVYVTIHDPESRKQLAQVVLNGYNIAAGGAFGHNGAMRSFKVVDGDLWSAWSDQATLLARIHSGKEARVKVAAMPAEEDSFGLMEFV